MINDVY